MLKGSRITPAWLRVSGQASTSGRSGLKTRSIPSQQPSITSGSSDVHSIEGSQGQESSKFQLVSASERLSIR